MPGASEAYQRTDQEPFSLPWVNSCYQQTLLPNAPWHKLEGHVAKALAGRVERQFAHPQRKEMLLELLGRHFVDTYLAHVERNPQVLDSSHVSGEEYERLRVEATSWLNNQMYKAVKDTGMQAVLRGASNETDPLSPEFSDFLEHTFTVFTSGMDRELFRQEDVLKAEKEKELRDPKKRGQKTDIFKVPAPSRLKAASSLGTLSSSSSASSFPKPSSAQLRGLVHTVQGDPPPLWGNQSDCLGAGVVSLLQRDPRKFDLVAKRLHGRQLPGSLRSYMWADVLLKGERRRMKEVYAEKVVREKFARAVTRGLTELKIKKPTQSPINGLIQNAVIETYSKTVSMLPYKHIDHVKEASRALNVLYVYDRSYEPYLVFWLFPLQIAFRDRDQHAADHGEHVLELAMYLDLLNSSCFPTWPQVFAVADCVMQRLQEDDPEFHNHIRHIATINVQGSPKRQDLVSEDYASKRTLRQPFQWDPLPDADRNDTQVRLCRNSEQGKSLIVDEKGYVCRREELSSNHCCDSKHGLVTRYVCESCLPSGCCSIYEHCVSCCLQPAKQPLLQRLLKEAVVVSFDRFAAEVKDQFELCLAKCRTSSQSVQHENSYRHPKVKYCYGDKPPDLQIVVS